MKCASGMYLKCFIIVPPKYQHNNECYMFLGGYVNRNGGLGGSDVFETKPITRGKRYL